MSKEFEGLIRAQFELYGRISRTYENFRKIGPSNVNTSLVEARLQALESNWKKFEAQHTKLFTTNWEALSTTDYQKNDLLCLTEETYINQKALLLEALQVLKGKEQEANNPKESSATSLAVPAVAAQSSKTTLPRIQLPCFSGRYEDWPPFRDLFDSIIGKDASLSLVEKLHYLKSCLQGEAELLVRNLPTTEENFGHAWKALTDHYENKRLLVRSYLSQFLMLPKLKGESASDLRKLNHGVSSTICALEGIGRPVTHGEDLFVFFVTELLDSRSRREWESSLSTSTEPPSCAALQQFLERRLRVLESLQPFKTDDAPARANAGSSRQTRSLHSRQQENKRGRCSVCHKDHYIMLCEAYQKKTATERKQHVDENHLCSNCLGRHKLSECNSQKSCSSCHARHHSTLHEAYSSEAISTTSHVARHPCKKVVKVLLATARVRVFDRFNDVHVARALIDQGSESSLISESLAQRLRLARSSTSVAVYGVGGKQTGFARGQVELHLASLNGRSPMTVTALVLPRLTLYNGEIKTNCESWTHLSGLELADPDFLAADPVEILLGAEVYALILESGLRKGGPQEPVAQQTSLGWILSGVAGISNSPRQALSHQCHIEEDLGALVRRFWQQEELPAATSALTPSETACEEQFLLTHSRTVEGRYVVRLPIAEPLPDFSATHSSALRMLSHMERRFVRDKRLEDLYKDFLRQYEELGHMSPTAVPGQKGRVVYLPHHGVLRESSVTTKLRVVFNGSSSIPSGRSLNDCVPDYRQKYIDKQER